ncbi:ribosome biogenesis protein ERB1 [Microdochium nivale]|nr:ribosome biogenesis protein ERB1 [Microdochium nivale]
MVPTKSTLKRKASVAQEDPAALSDDEFGGVALDGVLDGESDDEDFTDNDNQDQDDSDDLGSDENEDDDLASDDVPSEGEDAERKMVTNGAFDNDDELGPNYTVETDANGNTRYVYKEIDPIYDSDDSDANEGANTIGDIPLSFYDSYPHIGYTIDGKKILRPAAGDALDNLLDSIEVPKGWTGLTDPQTGKPLNLSQTELELLRKLQMGEIPSEGYDPYPDTVEWFTSQIEEMPLSAAPEPKRRFLPSKHEQKRIMKLVRAIKEGRIQPYTEPKKEDEDEEADNDLLAYDLWADEQPQAPHIMNIPAPKLAPPGYDLSYNPPAEYLPDDEERKKWEALEPEERDKEYLPQKYDSLRKTPGYEQFVKERFERCLDLYLAPRIRKNRLNIDPMSLLPKLPKPEELRPFPTVAAVEYIGHEGRVRSVAVDPTGEWLASGGDDGTVRVWGLRDGKQQWSVKLSSDEPVETVRWRPGQDASILAAVVSEDVFLMIPACGGSPELEQASRDILDAGFGYATNAKQLTTATGARKDPPAKWVRPGGRLEDEGVLLKATVRSPIRTLQWHRRGDYFCTVSPTGQRSSVAIHTLGKHLTQIPFRKLPGLAQTAQFHPSRPLFFVATQRMIRCYDLQRQELIKVVQPGARWISSFDIHPGGDNLVVGSYDRRLLWHELELSTRPFKTMRFHTEAIRAVKFHRSYPLFADASDDGTLQIFHSKVVNDVMEDPVIVPVKMLKGHRVVKKLGILDVDWHPQHPWCVSAGADGTCRLWQ